MNNLNGETPQKKGERNVGLSSKDEGMMEETFEEHVFVARQKGDGEKESSS